MKLPLQQVKRIDRWDSLRGSTSDTFTEETFGPLSNVRFAVFALGSSAYPNFCAFGQYVDNILGELGGERLLKVAFGDEMCGQEQTFRKWAPEVFKVSEKGRQVSGHGVTTSWGICRCGIEQRICNMNDEWKRVSRAYTQRA